LLLRLANLPNFALDRLMKPSFGAKSAKSCLPSTPWIAASRKIEGAVSMPVAGKHCRPTDGTTTELAGPPFAPSTQR
jgi:hypothetical protein